MPRDTLNVVISAACGLAILGVMAGLVLWVTNDMRHLLLIGAGGLFGAAAWLGGQRRAGVVSFVVLCLPSMLFFGLAVIPEVQRLWPHMLFWLCFALLGWFAFRSTKRFAQAGIAASLLLMLPTTWYGFSYVPRAISQTLTRAMNEPAPDYQLVTLEGVPVAPETFENSVVLLDYFATWCGPCIEELPEINAIHRRYANADDVVVLVVANDSNDDTPEAILQFAERRALDVDFVYDPDGVSHKAFGFAGLPGLVVIDKSDRIRFKREGYNAAESNFEEVVVGAIEALRAEPAT